MAPASSDTTFIEANPTGHAHARRGSGPLFHRLESANHRFDASTNLFVFLQQVGAFRRQSILALLQGTIFILKPVADAYQCIDALLKPFQFMLE
ncbi:MAG: hypothetical protein V3S15_08305 [Woeseiaceae bacterium]